MFVSISGVEVVAAKRKDSDQIRQERRNEILMAARKLFATKGFAATGIKEIAQEVGITHGTIYLYFQSKDEILQEVLRQGFSWFLTTVEEALKAPGLTPPERLRKAMYGVMALSQEASYAYVLSVLVQVYRLSDARDTDLALVSNQFWHRLWQGIRTLLEEGQREGYFREGDPDLMFDLITDFMAGHGLLYDHYKRLDQLIDLFLQMLAAR
jgi:AcrR family transcriptional regulator